MTIAAVADVHCGNIAAGGGRLIGSINDRCRYTLAALGEAVAVANKNKAPFVVLGDLFDASRPPPAVITAVADILQKAEWGAHVLVGNHDMNSDVLWDNSCSPLAREGVRVYEKPTVVESEGGFALMMVPFQPGPAREWLPQVIKDLGWCRKTSLPVVLCLHLGISDGNTPYYLDGHDDEVPVSLLQDLCADWGIDHVIAGNWHWHQSWNTRDGGNIVQVGTLAPVRHSDDGFNAGGVFLMDGESTSYHQVDGPRFLTVDAIPAGVTAQQYIPSVLQHAKDNHARPLFLKVRLPVEQHQAVQEAVDFVKFFVHLELQETKDEQEIDESELGEQIARLSTLPVDAAINEMGEEVAEELELDRDRLISMLGEYWGRA